MGGKEAYLTSPRLCRIERNASHAWIARKASLLRSPALWTSWAKKARIPRPSMIRARVRPNSRSASVNCPQLTKTVRWRATVRRVYHRAASSRPAAALEHCPLGPGSTKSCMDKYDDDTAEFPGVDVSAPTILFSDKRLRLSEPFSNLAASFGRRSTIVTGPHHESHNDQ